MREWLSTITNGNPRRLSATIAWEVMATVFQGAPYGFALFAILEYFQVLKTGAAPSWDRLAGIGAGLAASTAMYYLINRRAYQAAIETGCAIALQGQLTLAGHMRTLSMGFFSRRDPGDLSNLLIHDFENINTLVSRLFPRLLAGITFPLLSLVFLAWLDWKMALVVAAVIVFALPFIFLSRLLVRHWGQKHHQAVNETSARMLEYIGGIKPIKAHNLGGEKFQRLRQSFAELKKVSIRQEAIVGSSLAAGGIILHGVLPAVLLTGTWLLTTTSITPELLIVFLVVSMRICEPLMMALAFMSEIAYMTLSARRIRAVLDEKPLPEPVRGRQTTNYDICLKQVNFAYQQTPVLFDISCEIKENTMTALVGPSGSGKSTITRLIARFWDVNRGEITMGGVPITAINSEHLLSRIAVVFQDVYLFNDSVANNIAMGNPKASQDVIRAAAVKAGCHDFIMKLPEGYRTVLGEGGNTLSGGEKQRLSIARAIVKDAPVILLDEATASLDPENEVHIQEALTRLVKNKTLIVIAHRLQSIMNADQILVLDKGRIIERGAHNELLEYGGVYSQMWEEQNRAKSWTFKSGR